MYWPVGRLVLSNSYVGDRVKPKSVPLCGERLHRGLDSWRKKALKTGPLLALHPLPPWKFSPRACQVFLLSPISRLSLRLRSRKVIALSPLSSVSFLLILRFIIGIIGWISLFRTLFVYWGCGWLVNSWGGLIIGWIMCFGLFSSVGDVGGWWIAVNVDVPVQDWWRKEASFDFRCD